MTARLTTDLLVIGWGKGGKTLARALGSAGRRVVLVERDDAMVGGTCINIACVPTKALVHQAEQRRPEDDPETYLARAIETRDGIVERLREANRQLLATVDTITLVRGEAAFAGERTVRVTGGGEELEIVAEHVVINTGTVPRLPGIEGELGPRVHDSTTIQHLNDVRASMRDALTDAGVTILANAETIRLDDDGTVATVITSAGEVPADAVLLATGRTPATADLALSSGGFVAVDDLLRTSAKQVWAVGDVNGGQQLTPISLDDFRIVKAQLTDGTGQAHGMAHAPGTARSRADRIAVPTTIFTTPPLGRVGLTEGEAREQGSSVLVGAKPVAKSAAMPRPKKVQETHGIIRLVVDADSDLVLGAALHTVDAQEVINLVALAMRSGVTASALRDSV